MTPSKSVILVLLKYLQNSISVVNQEKTNWEPNQRSEVLNIWRLMCWLLIFKILIIKLTMLKKAIFGQWALYYTRCYMAFSHSMGVIKNKWWKRLTRRKLNFQILLSWVH